MAELIEVPFVVWTPIEVPVMVWTPEGPKKHILAY